jgi:Zn-dependent M28 family amino/carboxypeptidase
MIAFCQGPSAMKFYRVAALIFALCAGTCSSAEGTVATPQLGLPGDVTASMQGIDPHRIGEHVRFLANDLLEGRAPGTRGGDIAANYIAAQFALYGLKPAGDNGSYLQKVDFVGMQTLPATTASLQPAHGAAMDLKLAEDYVAGNQTQTDSADIDAPIVFVGYGIEAPEYKWDDFKGVDVKGKVVLVIVNEPPSKDPKFFSGAALTYYGRWTYKFEEAARQGAVGALIIHRTDLASYGWDVVRNSWSAEQVALGNDKDPKLQAAAWIQLEVARKLMSAANLNLDEMIAAAGTRQFQAKELPVRFKAHIQSKVRKFVSYNVLGLLPGRLSGAQAVVYSAHYDHLGIDPTLGGDKIYNGAVDNGTGCGILLEMAHAFTTSAARPPSPVLFAAVTAEEKGLLGSDYLGKHLPIAAGKIALDLNYDAILPMGMPQSVNVTGAERTSFYPTVEKTAAAFGFEIQADAEPGAGHYYRSDHFSMARAGVPAFSINTGVKFVGSTPEWGKAQHEEYTAKRYHRPSDEFSPAMDFTSDAAVAKFGYALGWQAMLAKSTVNWLPGDEFEAARLRLAH